MSDTPVKACDILGRLDLPAKPNSDAISTDVFMPSNEIKIIVHPEAFSAATGKVLSRAFGMEIVITENPFSELLRLREKGWTTIVIHAGARQHLSEVSHDTGRIAILLATMSLEKRMSLLA